VEKAVDIGPAPAFIDWLSVPQDGYQIFGVSCSMPRCHHRQLVRSIGSVEHDLVGKGVFEVASIQAFMLEVLYSVEVGRSRPI